MHRTLLALVLAAGFWAAADRALAQPGAGAGPAPAAAPATATIDPSQPWPLGGADYALDPLKFSRGPGFYLSWFKILLVWLIFLAWVFSTDWVNQDAQGRKLDYLKWNSITVFGFFVALLLVWVLPWFIVSLVLLLAAWVVPLAMYVRVRNAGLDRVEKVLTPDHLRYLVNTRILRKKDAEIKEKGTETAGPPIELSAVGGATDRDDKANTLKARHTPGFHSAGELLVDAILHRAAAVMLDFTKESVAVRYQIDGVWADQASRDRKSGDALLESLKTLAGLNPADRVSRQQGTLEAKHEKIKYTCRVASQGVKTGERAMVQFDDGTARKARLESINMPEKTQAALKALVAQPSGLVVVSAPPRGGFSSLLAATTTAVDRFMRSAMAMENAANPDMFVENVPVKTYSAKGPAAPAVLLEIIRQYPDVFVVPELIDGEVVNTLCNEVIEEKRLVVGGVRASEAVEAYLKLAALKPPAKQLLPALSGIVNVRLARKLCSKCKEAYKPAANVLQQLGLTPDKVESFYQPPKPPVVPEGKKPPPPCSECAGVGYKGQTAMFELLIVNDALRQALKGQADVKAIRQLARKVGMKTLQEEGIQLVVSGETSIQELMRVLKKEETKKEE